MSKNKHSPVDQPARQPDVDMVALRGQRIAADDRFDREIEEELQNLRALTEQPPGLTLEQHHVVEGALANLASKRSAGTLLAARSLRFTIQSPEANE